MEMETIKAHGGSAGLVKIELNENNEYTVISMDDTTFFDRFVAGFKEIADRGDKATKEAADIEEKYRGEDSFGMIMEKAAELSKINVGFSQTATEIIDGIFGEGTTRKYYREAYDAIPDFMPTPDSIIEFLDSLTPQMEALFKKRVEVREAERKRHMEKYKPQDHKRPKRKA
jgi:hypothetical protein